MAIVDFCQLTRHVGEIKPNGVNVDCVVESDHAEVSRHGLCLVLNVGIAESKR